MFLFFSFLVLYSFFFLPKFGFYAEMFAENATNYFNTAHTMPFAQGIHVTDYGYLPIVPRVVAYVVEWLGVSVKSVPVVYDLIATVVIALCLLSFVSSLGERVIQRPSLRYVFAFLMFMLPDYEIKSFINFPYWFFIPIFLLSLKAWYEPGNISWKTWLGFIALTCLAILSKPLFFVLVPGLFILGLRMVRERRLFGRAGLLVLVPISVLIQLKVSQGSHGMGTESFQLISVLYGLVYVPVALVEKIFGLVIVHNTSRIFLFAVGLSFGILFLWHFWKRTQGKARRELLVMLLFSSLIIYFNAFICLRSYSNYFEDISQFKLRPVMTLLAFRHWFFANLAAYFFVLKFYDVFPRSLSKLRLFFLLLLLFAGKHFSFPPHRIQESAYLHGNSDWQSALKTYGQDLTATDSFCIPVNPMSWFYLKNCQVIGDREEIRSIFQIDQKQWSEPATSYRLQFKDLPSYPAHWVSFHAKDRLVAEDILSLKIDGKEAPIRLFSEQMALTYLWLSRQAVVQEIEIQFRHPVQLETGREKQVLKIIAVQELPGI